MTGDENRGPTSAAEIWLVRGLQFALVGVVLYGAASLQFELAFNAAVPLAVTFLPAVLRREYDYTMDARLVLLVTVAVFLHALGSLGFYVQYSWYDEVTHTVSAVLVAGIAYATVVALERHSSAVDLSANVRGAFILVFVLAFGVLWEVFEFGAVWFSRGLGVKSPVQVFGIDDIVTDMIFNLVGGLLVAVLGTGYFDDLVPFLRRLFRS
jgi:hypothetical protein